MPEVAQKREARVDLASAFSLVSPRLSMSCMASRRPIELEQAGELGAVGLEHGRLARLAFAASARHPALRSSLIRARARPALVLKMKYLPTWAADGLKLYRCVGRGRRGRRRSWEPCTGRSPA